MITFTRGKLSKMSGVHIETIRFYEREHITAIVNKKKNMYSCYPLSQKQEN